MTQYDAIVVGSGAAGGWAAKELCEAGLSVLVLEAGASPPVRLCKAGMGASAWAKRIGRHYFTHRQKTQELHPSYWFKHPDLFVDDRAEPYETHAERRFNWIRGNQLGGRTLLWGGLSLRLSDLELGGAGGAWRGWPLRHADLDPWYTRVERFLTMEGGQDGLSQLPDGAFSGSSPLTEAEARFGAAVAKHFPERRLVNGRGIDERQRLFDDSPWSKLTSVGTTLHAARMTGRLTVRTDAVVSHLVPGDASATAAATTSPGRRAAGVAFVDRASGAWEEASGKLIVLCASTVQSVRILLSTAERYPESAPESDSLGRYLMDHVTTGTMVELPSCPSTGNSELTAPGSFLIPRWVNLNGGPGVDFAGGFGLWGVIQRGLFSAFAGRGLARGFIIGHGEMVPDANNRIVLSGVKDRLGIDRVYIEAAHGDNDRALRDAMRVAVAELVEAAGGRTRQMLQGFDWPGPWRFFARFEQLWREPPPGSYVHAGHRRGELHHVRLAGTDAHDHGVDGEGLCARRGAARGGGALTTRAVAAKRPTRRSRTRPARRATERRAGR